MPWNPIEQPVDYVILAGQRTPGIATIEGAGSPREWDERRGYGLAGSRLVFRGLRLSQFTLRLRLITVADWTAWEDFRPILDRPALGTRPRRALDISHPITDMLGIGAVVVLDVLQPVQSGDEWMIEIKLQEYRNPQPALGPASGADAARHPGNGTPEQQIESLTAQLAAEDQLDALSGGA